LTGAVTGKSGSTEGALVIASLYQRTANISSPIATILVDRRNVSVGNPFVDITATVSGGGFTASASANSLAIEILGEGQGIATIHGLVVDL